MPAAPARWLPALLMAAFAAAALLPRASAPALADEPRRPLDLATFPRTSLEITHHGGDHSVHRYPFEVWVADTPERAEQGLMFVSDLPPGMGMVFPVEPPRVETRWMLYTYIALDLRFVAADGRGT
jgi:uncharacterized protein